MICILEINVPYRGDVKIRYLVKDPQPRLREETVRRETLYFGPNPILPPTKYYEREIAQCDWMFLLWDEIGLWLRDR